ncbi:MAG TPA: TetR/AcrR family transcriptional regulator [Rhodoblastus sp.]|nr:TetR/AcrR family transcriptional regulator [Rhodoblastus sp.]
MNPEKQTARDRILDAAARVIRAQGYAGASVDELCAAAGVTKGAFFHHFKSKEAAAVAAAERFSEMADAIFAAAPYRALPDPVARVFGYVDFRKGLMQGELPAFTCLVGTMAQEAYLTHPAVRAACAQSIDAHVDMLEADVAEAMRARKVDAPGGARGLALYMQAVIQGAFVLAKAHGDASVAAGCLDHLRNHLAGLFGKRETNE